jgi:hypothetical protein
MKRLAKSLPLPAEGVVSSAALIAGCMIGAGACVRLWEFFWGGEGSDK